MKKTIILSGLAFALLTVACDDNMRYAVEGEGRVMISAELKNDVKVVSRAANEDELRQNLIVWISNSKGVVRKYNSEAEIPTEDWLKCDRYVAEAWAGDSVSASFDARWFKGSAEFEVKSGEISTVTIPCKIANVLASVNYADNLAEYFSDFSMTVGHKRGELTFPAGELRVGYFMMPSYDKNLKYTFTATTIDGNKVEKSGIITNAQPATQYVLNVHYDPVVDELGGTYMDIQIDFTEEDCYDEIEIDLPPVVQGTNGFDPNVEISAKAGEVGRRSLFVSSGTTLHEAIMRMDGLSDLLANDLSDAETAAFNDLDFLRLSEGFDEVLRQSGINFIYNVADDNTSTMKINLEEEFTGRLRNGYYEIEFIFRDAKLRATQTVIRINVSDDPMRIEAVDPIDVWATTATLEATLLMADVENAAIEYSVAGSDNWIKADTELSGDKLVAKLTGLEPATTYEYRGVCDTNNYVTSVLSFTTEEARQLPNAGFEEWQDANAPFLIYGAGKEMFWDSGNHGSSTMGKNVTVPDESVKHSGSRSIKLASQFVGIGSIGKFAAGNVFAGQYLATLGTDGVLGWGRPFKSRPVALKGYVKYEPKATTHSSTSKKPKGEMDEGIIYIALLDGSLKNADEQVSKYTDGVTQKQWPVIVNTKTGDVFDKDRNTNVIAYGELVIKEATDGMIEFTIPIEYLKQVKPSNIMITCSASRYGDFFTGGEGSTMWLDDFELIY